MTREELIDKVCPSDAITDCCSEECLFCCDDCNLAIENMLDEYDKQIIADYESACEKIYEDNPPMHFTKEQIMWIKEHIKLRVKQTRAEVIEELANKSFCEWTNCEDCAMWGQYDEFGEEEVCILEQLKEQGK